MRFFPAKASWFLAACIGAIVNLNAAAASVLVVDLAFPRNESYALTTWFPIVFVFRNSERAHLLTPHISYTIWSMDDDPENDDTSFSHNEMQWANWSSHDPYFVYKHFDTRFTREGRWWLTWDLTWQSCDEVLFSKGNGHEMIRNSTRRSVHFTIEKSAPEVDLIATANNKTCPAELGVAINVTDTTLDVPFGVTWSGGKTCAVVASSTPTPTADPCLVKINSAAVASISASLTTKVCDVMNAPPDCPKDDESAAQQQVVAGLSVVGISCLLTACGAFGFFLI